MAYKYISDVWRNTITPRIQNASPISIQMWNAKTYLHTHHFHTTIRKHNIFRSINQITQKLPKDTGPIIGISSKCPDIPFPTVKYFPATPAGKFDPLAEIQKYFFPTTLCLITSSAANGTPYLHSANSFVLSKVPRNMFISRACVKRSCTIHPPASKLKHWLLAYIPYLSHRRNISEWVCVFVILYERLVSTLRNFKGMSSPSANCHFRI